MPKAKPKKSESRKVGIVRSYLTNLRDDPDDRKSTETLQAVAKEHDIPIRTLRNFREGKDDALPQIILNAWAKVLGTDGTVTGVSTASSPTEVDWYQRQFLAKDGTRIERYGQYEQIDDTRPEASSALACWADVVCTGGVGDNRRMDFEPDVDSTMGTRTKTMLKEIADHVNTWILPPEEKLKVVRDMAKYGDQYEQIGVGQEQGKQPSISRLVNMPVKTMAKNFKGDGTWDIDNAYVQILPGTVEPVGTWPAWKIVNFTNQKSRGDHYGSSIFESCLRSYVQVEAMEAAMIIRRLERAPLRMKHILDVGHLSGESEIIKVKEDYRTRNKKIRTVDQNKVFGLQRINMPADEDYIVPKRDKNSPADVVPLDGDAHIGVISDFIHFFNKFLAGLGPPKAHLGYEGETMRSVITDLHIVFARKARRMAMAFIKGLNQIYWLEMIFRGVDPRSVNYQIVPPAMGTRDELIRAQVMSTHAQTVRFLAQSFAQTGKVPSIRWFLRYMMNLDDETMDALELDTVMLTTKGALDRPLPAGGGDPGPTNKEAVELANAAFENPEISDAVGRTRWLLEERAIGKKKPEIFGLVMPKMECPFGYYFDDIVRMILPVGERNLKVMKE